MIARAVDALGSEPPPTPPSPSDVPAIAHRSGSEHDTRFDAAELAAEVRRALEERYVTQLAPQRTLPFLAGVVLLCAALWGASLFPAAQRLLRVPPGVMGSLMLVEALTIAVATLCARTGGGLLGRAHRVAERAETSITAGVLCALIFASGTATSFFWLVVVLHVLHCTVDGLHATFARYAYIACFGALAAAFEAVGQRGDALLVAFFGVVVALIASVQDEARRRFLEVLATRNLYRRRFEAVLVEQERQRIARDLHDGLGGQLAALAWVAAALSPDALPDKDRELVGDISARARVGLTELRSVVHRLSSVAMLPAELALVIEKGVRPLVPPSCQLAVHAEGSSPVHAEVGFHVGMMVREAVQNAVHHGAAKHVRVELACGPPLVVRVVDDGGGIPEGAFARSRGGLANMKERAALIGGELRFETSGTGTSVSLRIAEQGPSPTGRA